MEPSFDGLMQMPKACPALAYDPMIAESCGTTLIAVEFKDGVVFGADSRTSAGSYVTSRVTDKLTEVTDHIYCCRSGSAADTQAITDIVKYRLQVMRFTEDRIPSVHRAAQVFRSYCYEYRDQMSASVLVCGWDEEKGGQIYSVPIGGFTTRQRVAASGSGSTFVLGYLDSHWKENMTEAEAKKVVLEAVSLAILRDGSSGGVCRLGIMTKDGMRRELFTPDQDNLAKFAAPKPITA